MMDINWLTILVDDLLGFIFLLFNKEPKKTNAYRCELLRVHFILALVLINLFIFFSYSLF